MYTSDVDALLRAYLNRRDTLIAAASEVNKLANEVDALAAELAKLGKEIPQD